MRISYVARSTVPSRTANSIHVMRMCGAYACLGHTVGLVVPRYRAWEEQGIKDDHEFYGMAPSFSIRKVPAARTGLASSLALTLGLPAVARWSRPDFVHTRSLGAVWGLTCVFHLPTLLELHREPPAGRLSQLFAAALRSGHVLGVVAITEALAARIRPLVPSSVSVLVEPDAVERAWVESPLSTGEARSEIGLSGEERPLVVYAGHLYDGRGVHLMLDLARVLPDHLFVLVGGQRAQVEELRDRAASLGNLQVVGFVPPAQVFPYLRAADALLMPYGYSISASGGGDISATTSPLKMFEYMAAGRPILASDLPVLREILVDGQNSLLLPPGEPAAWAEALLRLGREPTFAQTLATRARAEARRYTWEARAQRLVEHASSL